MKLPPCNNCKDRSSECHATCDKYAEWSDQHESERRKKREADSMMHLGKKNRHFWG